MSPTRSCCLHYARPRQASSRDATSAYALCPSPRSSGTPMGVQVGQVGQARPRVSTRRRWPAVRPSRPESANAAARHHPRPRHHRHPPRRPPRPVCRPPPLPSLLCRPWATALKSYPAKAAGVTWWRSSWMSAWRRWRARTWWYSTSFQSPRTTSLRFSGEHETETAAREALLLLSRLLRVRPLRKRPLLLLLLLLPPLRLLRPRLHSAAMSPAPSCRRAWLPLSWRHRPPEWSAR